MNVNATATANTSVTLTANAFHATATTQASSVAATKEASTATATVQLQASATAAAQATATATVQAFLNSIPCTYMYWMTGIKTKKQLTKFGVPPGCDLFLDSESGNLNGVSWSVGGVMAFPSGVYNGFIDNGEYEIVPEKANPNPQQVFCNRVQEVVMKGYDFTQAQPLLAWGLPPGDQIVTQRHC